MHSIASVRSSGGAANYFAADNYYTLEENAEAGAWGGKGSEVLGLAGPVGKEAFEKILNGELPTGQKIGQVEGRRIGLDMTFSMPKSASVMALVVGDKRILEANLRAVVATMKYAERNFAEARNYERNRSGEPEKTGNLVYALFAHDTSRALDPQGHIHAVVANLTQTKDGTWKALWNEKLWQNNTTIGQVYHAALRAELQKLGYELTPAGKHGTFEIKGVPKAVNDEYSQRTAEINKEIKKWNATTLERKKEITLYTREDKQHPEDRGALLKEWQDRAASLGFDGKDVLSAALEASKEQSRPGIMERASLIISEMKERFGAASTQYDGLTTGGTKALFMSAGEIRAEHTTASAIEQGKMFAVSQASGHKTVRMDENVRQRNSPLLMAVAGLSNEGHASLALDLLNAHGRVTEAGKDSIATTAQLWLSLSPAEREKTAIFTAGRDDRTQINSLVQQGLKDEGVLKGDGVTVKTLQSANTTREELRYASSYSRGQILEARMDVREINLGKGQWEVTRVHQNGKVELTKDGKNRTIDPSRLDPNHKFDRMSLMDRKEIKLHEGDTIFWRDKDTKNDIQKSTYSKILSADGNGVTVELPDKRQITLPTGHPMLERLDLGYALNAHMVQGMTKPEAIEHISSRQTNLATQCTQNVLNTRATDDMRVVTDNLDGLKRQLDHNAGNKTSAVEAVGRVEVDPARHNPIDTRQLPSLDISPELRAKLDCLKGAQNAPVKQLPVPEKTMGLDLA